MSTERKNITNLGGQENQSQKGGMSFDNFLELVPLYIEKHVAGFHEIDASSSSFFQYASGTGKPDFQLKKPSIRLFCPSRLCNGERIFEVVDCDRVSGMDIWGRLIFTYECRNCKQEQKTYIIIASEINNVLAKVEKIGEFPQFRPHISNRVISLIEPDKELFNQGLLSESKGLGIGALTYYRRVVDNQWRRLLQKIKEAAEKQEVPKSTIQLIDNAQKEEQFAKAVDMVKDAIPQTLRIRGHNPITLLYSETSQGIHELTDEQCLQRANSIRIILSKLADHIHQSVKDEAKINAALTQIFSTQKKKESQQSNP